MMNKESAAEVERISREIAHQEELLKDFAERIEAVQTLKEKIKDINEEIKALVAADEECFAISEQIKSLKKELSQAAKVVAKNTSFKPAVVKGFFKAKVKGEEAIQKVVEKGSDFNTIESLIK
jgi:chromosome segregation ATPase